MSTLSTSVPAVGDAALSDSAGRVRGHCRAGDDRARAYHADMAKIAAVAFTMGLAMLGIGLPDLLPDDAKLWVVIAALVFLVTGVGLWTVSRWTIVRRDQLRLPSPVAELPTPLQSQAQLPTRVPLIQALEQHASRLSDMLDARFVESPGPKGRLSELMTRNAKRSMRRPRAAGSIIAAPSPSTSSSSARPAFRCSMRRSTCGGRATRRGVR